jgi:hypothetical protein
LPADEKRFSYPSHSSIFWLCGPNSDARLNYTRPFGARQPLQGQWDAPDRFLQFIAEYYSVDQKRPNKIDSSALTHGIADLEHPLGRTEDK